MEPTKRKKGKFLRPLGYAALAVFAFLLSLWWLFPYDDVARRAETMLAARGIEARIDHLHPTSLFSLGADSIHITRWQETPLDVTLGPTTVSFRFGPVFDGKIGLDVESRSFGGELTARLDVPQPASVEATWKGLDLAKVLPLVFQAVPAPQGVSDGSLTAGLPYAGLSRLRGTLSAELRQVSVGPGVVSGFPAPQVALGSGTVQAEAANGRLRVYNTKFSGGDLDISADGNVTLAAPALRSAVDASVTLRPTRKAENELGLLFGLMASTKAPDGSFNVKIKGTLSSPLIQSR